MSEGPARFGFDRARLPAYVALLSAPVLLLVWRYRGMAWHFDGLFGLGAGGATHDLWSFVYQFGAFFLLAFAVPFGLLRLVPPRTPGCLGLGRPVGTRSVWLTILLAIPIVVLIAWLGSRMPDVRGEYPMLRSLWDRSEWLLPYEAAYVLLYYVAWEAYFRGYLLFTLEGPLGGFTAVLVQTIASALVHIGKPESEALGSIPFGIVMGLIALRTRSIWPTFVLHATLGVSTDLFVLQR